MAVDVGAIRQGIADAVNGATGLRMFPHEPAQLHTPCGWVVLGEPFMPEPHEAFQNGLARVSFIVRVAVGTAAGTETALSVLDPYMGSGPGQTKSILDALLTAETFGDSVNAGNLRVETITGIQPRETLSGLLYVGFDVPFFFYVTRT